MTASVLVIAISSSASGGVGAPSGDTGAQRLVPRVTGAVHSGAAGRDPGVAQRVERRQLHTAEVAGSIPAAGVAVSSPGAAAPVHSAPDVAKPSLGAVAETGSRRNTDERLAALGSRSLHVSGAVQTAGSSVLPTALTPAAQTGITPLRRWSLGRFSATRTAEVAVGSGGEADCRSARKAIRFYSRRVDEWRAKMGAGAAARLVNRQASCPRYLAHVWQRKARGARLTYERWFEYHFRWQIWLPDKWQRIGACETGYGKRPGNWRHSNSSYEGAFGFALSSWDAFVPRADPKAGPYPANAYLATPRQQYEVALAIQRMYGLSGWGCRNA